MSLVVVVHVEAALDGCVLGQLPGRGQTEELDGFLVVEKNALFETDFWVVALGG